MRTNASIYALVIAVTLPLALFLQAPVVHAGGTAVHEVSGGEGLGAGDLEALSLGAERTGASGLGAERR